MADEQIKVFHEDDTGYVQWTAWHGGYVLKDRGNGEHMLHRADCDHLGTSHYHRRLTRLPRRWSSQKEELAQWAERQPGATLLHCQSCM